MLEDSWCLIQVVPRGEQSQHTRRVPTMNILAAIFVSIPRAFRFVRPVRNILIIFFSMSVIGMAQAKEDSYLFGVFPHLPARDLEKVYSPMAAELGKVLGKKVSFRSASTFDKFMQNLRAGKYDIAFVQPFDYVWAHDDIGYKPIVTRIETLATVFVVLPESKIQSVADFKGKKIALPPDVAAVSYLTKAHLKENGLKVGEDVELSHHRSHVSCMQQVVIKAADICGTAAPAVRFFEHKMNRKMRVVAKTTEIPHSLFISHPRVSESEREVLKNTMLNLHKTVKGREMFKRGKLKSFKAVTDSEYDVVRNFSK